MILPRMITAVFFVPMVIAAVWAGSLPFFIFVLGVALLSYWEYSLMADAGGYPNQLFFGMAGTVVLVSAFYLDGAPAWAPLHKAPSVLFVLVALVLLSFLVEFFKSDKSHSFLRVITTIAGVVMCGVLLGHLVLVRDLRVASGEGLRFVGRELTFFLVLIIWAVDTGAWMVGKMAGRFALAPQISPKKTWTGLMGGLAAAAFVGWIYSIKMTQIDLSVREGVFLALLVAILAQVSDLVESLLKRTFGVKDSSGLLPGHGGILDRFDSFLFAAPAFYYALVGTGRFQ